MKQQVARQIIQSNSSGKFQLKAKNVLFAFGLLIYGNVTTLLYAQDKPNKILMINGNEGWLKISNKQDGNVEQKYFSDQNRGFFKEILSPFNKRGNIESVCEYSEDKSLVVVYREAPKTLNFKNELTLINESGETLFQNRAPDSITGRPLKVFKDLQIILIDKRPLSGRYPAERCEFYGVDFKGKKIWEFYCEDMSIDWNELKTGGSKRGYIKLNIVQYKSLNWGFNSIQSFGSTLAAIPSGLALNVKTGFVDRSNLDQIKK